MARKPRSRKQALILCMEMYEWIRDNPNADKYNWPRANEWRYLESKYHNCFCCMFADFQCTEKCPLIEWAWFEKSSPSAPCTHSGSLCYGIVSGSDKMVWACYAALNELSPKEFPL